LALQLCRSPRYARNADKISSSHHRHHRSSGSLARAQNASTVVE